MSRILFAGGGSGGHLYPGVSLAERFLADSVANDILFVGSNRMVERQILQSRGLPHQAISPESFGRLRRNPVQFFAGNLACYREANRIVRDFGPRVVIGVGGSTSLPTVIAAWKQQVPIVLLEQNAVLGRANELLLRFASDVCLSFPQTPIANHSRHKVHHTGNPVRKEFLDWEECQSSTSSFRLLVLGGSQGSRAVNRSVLEAADQLKSELTHWSVLHQTGRGEDDHVREGYQKLRIKAWVAPFLNDIATELQTADVVVTQAGATTLAELAICEKPAILIPFANSVRDHQVKNAEYFAEAGAAEIVLQSSTLAQTGQDLATRLGPLLTQMERRQTMGEAMSRLAIPDATERVFQVVSRHLTRSSTRLAS